MAKHLFEESRYCFVYGQFLAAIVLGLSYIDHTLADLFYASGRNDLKRSGISTLLHEALTEGWISQTEVDDLHHAREIRNPITHFREPGHATTIEEPSLTQSNHLTPSASVVTSKAAIRGHLKTGHREVSRHGTISGKSFTLPAARLSREKVLA